jgi:hypothetical protein
VPTDNFTFYNPTRVIFGKDTVGQIGRVIRGAGLRRVLLVAGSGSTRKNGVYDAVVRRLKKAGFTRVKVWGVRPNPVLAKARERSSPWPKKRITLPSQIFRKITHSHCANESSKNHRLVLVCPFVFFGICFLYTNEVRPLALIKGLPGPSS